MRPWRIRLTVRRSRVQWALLSIVLLVSVLSSTMLSSLFLLSSATERFAAREALTNAPDADIRVTHSFSPNASPEEIISGSASAAEEFFGDVPFETQIRIQGKVLGIPREDRPLALGYFVYQDGVEENAVLSEGRWPADIPGSTIEASIPIDLLEDLSLAIGDEVEVFPYGRRADALTLEIVGAYQARDPEADFWRFDPNNGLGYVPDFAVPLSGGRLTADGFGPLFITRDVIDGLDVSTLTVDYLPDFSEATLVDVGDIIDGVEDIDLSTTIAVGAKASTVDVFTQSDSTLGKVLGSLAVTRSSVLVTGLLLLVLAIAALGQTSRLMAERRHAEQHLMTARGASGRQLFRLGVIEAVVLSTLTTVAGPLLANRAYRLIAGVGPMKSAGMDRDPGLPSSVWIVSGVVGVALLIILVAPLLKRGVTFVEGEQARSRPSRATSLQRSGLDFALVALAVLAYLQLRGYQSPIMTTGGVARVDPVLASGPALALLAGALVCMRLIPAASKFLEGIASRGRHAVGPLAAWEVGRRSARAVSAILLLTLAVSVGSFSMSFLTTWRTSQEDQASFLHPADVEVSDLDMDPLEQYAAVNNAQLGAAAAPVFERDGEMTTSLQEGRSGQGINGRSVHLVATTDDGLTAYTDGRVGSEGGSTIAEALTKGDTTETVGIPLPGDPDGVQFTLTLTSSETDLAGLVVRLRLLVRDSNGTFTSLDGGTLPIDGEERTIQAMLPTGVTLASSSSIVGLQTLWFISPGVENDRGEIAREGELELELSIDGVSSLIAQPPVPVPGVQPQYDAVAAEIPADVSWYGRAEGVIGPSLNTKGDQVHIQMEVPSTTLFSRTISISQGAFPFVAELPVVANQAVLTQLGLSVGDRATVEINNAVFTVHFVGSVPLMPGGSPRNPTLVANYDDLQIMLMQGGAPSPGVTGWWTDVPQENTARYLDALPLDATTSTRLDTVHSLQDDPLRVGIQAALWLVTAAAIVLAALGFAVHTVVTVRARELEFAQLRAVGLARSALTRLVSAESLLLAILGTFFGLVLGIALGYLVAPLISVGPDGRPPVPGVIVDIPWGNIGLLAAEVAAVLAIVVFLVSLLVRRINPAALLRVEG
ncbi:MAG: hypothetical protein JW722_03170 [Demequinaceae bacterium]|nr:hypothetical protein [Demequinaceae bacterium]